jgi:hypothetical protein
VTYLSPRVSATMMSDSDFMNPTPIVTDANLLDGIVSVKDCLSTSRPASPFEGQWIYETDTQVLRRWSSSDNTWRLRAGSINSTVAAVGLISTTSNAAAATIPNGASTSANVALVSWNTSVKKNKTYKIVEDGWISLTGSAGLWTDTGRLSYNLQSYANIGSPPTPIPGSTDFLDATSLTMPKGAMPTRFPFHRTWFYDVPNTSGSLTLYGALYLITDATKITSGLLLGKPADSVPATVRVYDCGLTTGN